MLTRDNLAYTLKDTDGMLEVSDVKHGHCKLDVRIVANAVY